jgi:hypothetical protein
MQIGSGDDDLFVKSRYVPKIQPLLIVRKVLRFLNQNIFKDWWIQKKTCCYNNITITFDKLQLDTAIVICFFIPIVSSFNSNGF